jgi:uncharacterized protein YbjT (DUF2867 family)
VARILIVACGCRGRALASALAAEGHAVRGTTRDPGAAVAIAGAGAEPFVGDPDRIGTLMPALDAVTIVCWLLGSARGEEAALTALHGTRLRFFLEKCVDTTVRGFVYEAAGSAGAERLQAGAGLIREAGATWEIPYAPIDADPADPEGWVTGALGAIHALLEP